MELQPLSWSSLSDNDGNGIKAPTIEQFLWGCDLAVDAKAVDMEVVKTVLFRCLRDYAKARGIVNRSLQLLHDVHTRGNGTSSNKGINDEDLTCHSSTIEDTFSNALQYADIMSSLMQLLSLLAECDFVQAKFDKSDSTGWCLSDAVVRCMTKHPGSKAVQKAATQLLKEVLRRLCSPATSKKYNITSLRCAEALMQPLLHDLTMHQEDAELLSNCCAALRLLVQKTSSSVIEVYSDEIVAAVLSVALKNAFNASILRPCLAILDTVAVGEHHMTSIASTDKGLLLFVDALALSEDEKLGELALGLLLRGLSSKAVQNFVFGDVDSTQAFVGSVRRELDSRSENFKSAVLKKIVDEVRGRLVSILPPDPPPVKQEAVPAGASRGTSPEKKNSPTKSSKQIAGTPVASSPIQQSSSSSEALQTHADNKKYDELITKLHIGGDLILKLKEEVRELRAANERLQQEGSVLAEERDFLGRTNVELVNVCRNSQEQAEQALTRFAALQALVEEARDKVQALAEENEELRRGGYGSLKAFEINRLNTTTTHVIDTSVDFPLSPDLAVAKARGAPSARVAVPQKTYDEGLRSLCEAAVGEALGDAAPEDALKDVSSQTVRLFCSAKHAFLSKGQLKQSNVSVSSLRLFLRDIEVVDGRRCKQRDVDIMLSQLGVQQCLSIFGFTYVLVLCARKKHPNLSPDALLLRLAADIRTYVESGGAAASQQQQAKTNQFDSPEPLSPEDVEAVKRFFDAEKQALGIIYHAYLPKVPRERSETLTSDSNFVIGIDSGGVATFSRDFDLVPAVLNNVELSHFFASALTSSNSLSAQQEPVLSPQQFQALLLQLALSCQCFRDQLSDASSSSQSAVKRLANLFFWLDNSAGKDIILQRQGNLGVLKFKNAVKASDVVLEKRVRTAEVTRSLELQKKIGPSKNIVTLFKN